MTARLLAVLLAVASAMPARAADLFGGVYAHDVHVFAKNIREGGSDFELGYRFAPVVRFGPAGGPAPYVVGSINSAGGIGFGAAGLAWKFGGPLYVRPGLDIAVQSGRMKRFVDGERVDLGSRVLFEPELAVGVELLPRVALEASFVHLSHAQIFGHQNPGLDMAGLRLNLHLP